MSERGRRRRAPVRAAGPVLVAFVAVLLGAGCGVPSSDKPVIDGDGPVLGQRNSSEINTPLGPDGVDDPEALLRRYLQAAAGRLDAAPGRIRQFLTATGERDWAAGLKGNRIDVVRTESITTKAKTNGSYEVTVALTAVGVLDEKGSVSPVPAARQTSVFEVVPVDDQYRLNRVPPQMLLDAGALSDYYVAHDVYYWSAETTDASTGVLVPDLRYVPRNGTFEQNVVEYLLDGPSTWLAPAVRPWTKPELDGRVVRNDNRLQVNLSAKAAAKRLDRFMAQLRWSLLPEFTGSVDLQVGGSPADNVDGTSRSFRSSLPFVERRQASPQRFGVVAGVATAASPVRRRPQVLEAEQNRDVQSAALSWDEKRVALVRAEQGASRLWVGHSLGAGDPIYLKTGLSAKSMSRPVWFTGPTGPGLYVVADGVLRYLAVTNDVSGDTPPKVDRVNTGLGALTSVAVAPDGRRVALVSGNTVSVATLSVQDGVPVLSGNMRAVPVGLSHLAGVGWISQNRLLVAGRAVRNVLREITIDGALAQDIRVQLLDNPIAHLASYAIDPTLNTDERGPIMVQYREYITYSIVDRSSPQEVTPDVPNSASTVQTDAEQSVLAPFFVDY